MKISIGSDHRGFILKEALRKIKNIELISIEWVDAGCFTPERCDYPIFAKKVASDVLSHHAEFGILICGSGVGMAIAANRFKGIYSGVAWNKNVAIVSHEDDNVNILSIPSDYVSQEEGVEIAKAIIQAWAKKSFKSGRYLERIKMVDEY